MLEWGKKELYVQEMRYMGIFIYIVLYYIKIVLKLSKI